MKECKSQTTKLVPPLFQDTMWSVFGSSTISNVLIRNGGGPISCNPSIGFGGDGGTGVLGLRVRLGAQARGEREGKQQGQKEMVQFHVVS